MSHDGVWQTTADDIADYYIANYYDEAVAHAARLNNGGIADHAFSTPPLPRWAERPPSAGEGWGEGGVFSD